MEKFMALVIMSLLLCILLPLSNGGRPIPTITQDGSEEWGYVEVRPSEPFTCLNFL